MYSKMISILPIIVALLPSTFAAPAPQVTPTTSATSTTTSTDVPSATMVTFFVDDACSSEYNQAYQTVANGTCMDLGEDFTTRSIGMSLTDEGDCVVRVWNDETCGADPAPDMKTMEMQCYQGNMTCAGPTSGQKSLGSAMLVCS